MICVSAAFPCHNTLKKSKDITYNNHGLVYVLSPKHLIIDNSQSNVVPMTQRKSCSIWFSWTRKKFSTTWSNPILNVVSPQIWSTFSSKVVLLNISTFFNYCTISRRFMLKIFLEWHKDLISWCPVDWSLGNITMKQGIFLFQTTSYFFQFTFFSWMVLSGGNSEHSSLTALGTMMNHYFHNLYQFWPWRK